MHLLFLRRELLLVFAFFLNTGDLVSIYLAKRKRGGLRRVLILLVLRNEILHVGLRLSELERLRGQ